jgi:hypothetical protein
MRNIILIILGVVFLLWLSTFGDSEVRSKMEFYSSTAGTFVALSVFMLPLILASNFLLSRGERRSVKVQLTVGVVMIAFIPNIIDLYIDVGGTISNSVISAKG